MSKAYADFSLAVFPPIIQIEAKPPANISTPFQIENLGSETLNLQIVLKPFVPSDQENGQVRSLKDNEIPDYYSLILPGVRIIEGNSEVKEVTLEPKQRKELMLNINIPREIPSRDYYFSVVFLSKGQEITERTATQALGGLATNVLLSVGSTGIASGVIQEFSSPIFIEKGPVPFTVRVKNTGNHFIAPKGEIIIRNLLGEEVGRVNLLPVNVLAGSVRSIPSDTFDTSDTFAYWNEKFVLGPYKATLNLALSDSGPLFSREIIFFAFPGMTILAILGGFIILLYLYSRVRMKI